MQVGDEVRGLFGTMIPEWYGKIVKVEENGGGGLAVDIEFENGQKKYLMDFELRDDYFTPKLPAVGYFLYKEND